MSKTILNISNLAKCKIFLIMRFDAAFWYHWIEQEMRQTYISK